MPKSLILAPKGGGKLPITTLTIAEKSAIMVRPPKHINAIVKRMPLSKNLHIPMSKSRGIIKLPLDLSSTLPTKYTIMGLTSLAAVVASESFGDQIVNFVDSKLQGLRHFLAPPGVDPDSSGRNRMVSFIFGEDDAEITDLDGGNISGELDSYDKDGSSLKGDDKADLHTTPQSNSGDAYKRKDLSKGMFTKLNFSATELSGLAEACAYVIGDKKGGCTLFGRVTQEPHNGTKNRKPHHAIDYNTFFLPSLWKNVTVNQEFDVRGGLFNASHMALKKGWRKSIGYFFTGSCELGNVLAGHLWYWKDSYTSSSMVGKYTGNTNGPHIHFEIHNQDAAGRMVNDNKAIIAMYNNTVMSKSDIIMMLDYIIEPNRSSFKNLKLSRDYKNGLLFDDSILKSVLSINPQYGRALSGLILLVQGTIECLDPCITKEEKDLLDKKYGSKALESEAMASYIAFDDQNLTGTNNA